MRTRGKGEVAYGGKVQFLGRICVCGCCWCDAKKKRREGKVDVGEEEDKENGESEKKRTDENVSAVLVHIVPRFAGA
jgi:hypothetical protein